MTAHGRLVDAETLDTVRLLREAFSLRQIAEQLGVSHGTVDAILRNRPGAVSLENENRIRAVFDLSPLTIPAIPCPTCGQLHQVGDCHGQSGAVAIIPAGARIVPPSKRKRPPYKRPTWAQVRALEARIAELEERNR